MAYSNVEYAQAFKSHGTGPTDFSEEWELHPILTHGIGDALGHADPDTGTVARWSYLDT